MGLKTRRHAIWIFRWTDFMLHPSEAFWTKVMLCFGLVWKQGVLGFEDKTKLQGLNVAAHLEGFYLFIVFKRLFIL